jgi:hypothetical protein
MDMEGDLRNEIATVVKPENEFVIMWKKELVHIDRGIWEPDIYVSDPGWTG